MHQKSDNVFVLFLELLGVKHTREFSNRYFNEHPHKYNLLGLSKMLSDYGVENAGTRIVNKAEDIFKIELPFIAHIISDFVVVHTIEKDKVHCLWNSKELAVPVSSFMEVWSGIVLLAEAAPNSIEPDYKEHKKQELLGLGQKILLSAAIGLVLVFAYLYNALFQNIGLNLLLLLNLAGIYTGYLLVLKQLHIHSRYADKICSLFSQSDCNNVLESPVAKLGGVFGWSEIGLGYFTANLLIILFVPQWISFLAVINIFTLPYTFWSIWYQKVRAKQWCPLCLIVQALLWAIFIVNLLCGFIQIPAGNWTVLAVFFLIACLYGIFMLIFNLLIPKLSESSKIEQLNQEINSIKANEDVFINLLKQQPYYETNKSDSQILFGNPDANLQITVLTNPFCNPCAKMHRRIEKFLRDTKSNASIRYIFSSFEPRLDFVNKCLIAVQLEKDQTEFERIIAGWFTRGIAQRDTYFNDLQLDMSNPDIEAEFQQHEFWKVKTKLRATPTLVVNGYQLPEMYKIEDLKYFTNLKIDVNQPLPR